MPVSEDQLNQLKFKRGKMIDDGRAIIAKAESEGRGIDKLTAEERSNYNKMWDDQKKLESQIEIEEREFVLEKEKRAASEVSEIEKRHREMEAELAKGSDDKKKAAALAGLGGDKPEAREKMAKEAMAKRGAEYREKYSKYLAGFASALEVRDLQKDVGTSGGYLVAPEIMASDLIKNVVDLVYMRKFARQQTIRQAASLGIPKLKTRMAAATWGSELVNAGFDQTLDFGKRAFFPHPGSAAILVSRDLLQLAEIDPEGIVRFELARVLSELEENGFMTGDGDKKPLGLFTASNDGIDTSRDISTDNNTDGPTFDGLKRAKRSVKPQYQANCRWLWHPQVSLYVSMLKDGMGRYIWNESTQVGDPDMCLGRPVVESYFAPSVLTTGQYVGIYGDLSEYQIVDTLALSILRLDELYAMTNQVAFLARFHVDGAPRIAEAFARIKLA